MIKFVGFDSNFWEINPQIGLTNPFKDLHKSDKSRGKVISSKMMWFIVLVYDYDSIYFNLNLDDRIKLIIEDFINEANWYKSNKERIDLLASYYSKLQDTPAIRQLKLWNQKMDEKTKFMEETPYNEENWEMLDKMIKSNVDAYKSYQQIYDMIYKSEASKGVGGAASTLSDSGEI